MASTAKICRESSTPSGALPVKAKCLPFSQIPHTTKLFTDFLSYSPQVRPFYPRSPYFRDWVNEEAAAFTRDAGYSAERRERVAAVLERQNEAWGGSPKAAANLERFRRKTGAPFSKFSWKQNRDYPRNGNNLLDKKSNQSANVTSQQR